jgi:hypothetical protein
VSIVFRSNCFALLVATRNISKGMKEGREMRNENLKNFLSPITRVCAEIVEVTGNMVQGARRCRRASTDTKANKNHPKTDAANNRANSLPTRTSLRDSRPTEACASSIGIENLGSLEFDVECFCSELEALRAALAPQSTTPSVSEHQRSAKAASPVENREALKVTCDSRQAPASLESEVTVAVRKLEGSPILGPIIERVSRGANC